MLIVRPYLMVYNYSYTETHRDICNKIENEAYLFHSCLIITLTLSIML